VALPPGLGLSNSTFYLCVIQAKEMDAVLVVFAPSVFQKYRFWLIFLLK